MDSLPIEQCGFKVAATVDKAKFCTKTLAIDHILDAKIYPKATASAIETDNINIEIGTIQKFRYNGATGSVDLNP